MHFSNGSHRRTFSFLALIALAVLSAGLLAACGDPATAIPFDNTAAITTAATPPASRTSSIAQATTSAATTTGAAATSAVTTAAPATTAVTNNTTSAASVQATPGQTTLETVPATIAKANGEIINMTIELARTGQEQETGLMGRLSVPDETGMLFIFPQTGRVGFWMKDTPLALSIAFITQDGKIIDIQDMESYSLDIHSPNQDYIYALEVAKGYFAKRGVKPGDTFTFKS